MAFRSELRAMGLRAPGDPDAPATAISADVRPDLFARSALAASAISPILTERPARRSRASTGVDEGQPGDGLEGGETP